MPVISSFNVGFLSATDIQICLINKIRYKGWDNDRVLSSNARVNFFSYSNQQIVLLSVLYSKIYILLSIILKFCFIL